MAYLIHTDRKNLLQSIRHSMIRIPRYLRGVCDIHKLKRGENIYFYDFENGRIYGPAKSTSDCAVDEKNPPKGPFNGPVNAKRHYHYMSLKVSCSSMFKRGVPLSETGIPPESPPFYLSSGRESALLERLRLNNREYVPLVVHLDIHGREVHASVVEVGEGTDIRSYRFELNENVYGVLQNKKTTAERVLLESRKEDFRKTVRKIGKIVFENFLRHMDFERVFDEGGYTIQFIGRPAIAAIPFEIACRGTFLFEKNLLSFRRENAPKCANARLKNALIVADPAETLRGAYEEGISLFHYLGKQGVTVDLCSRRMKKQHLAEIIPDYDVIHFSGHCGNRQGVHGWDIGTSIFSAEDVMESETKPMLVFSSSCGDTLGLGFSFIGAGVGNAVASRWQVPDGCMSDFVRSFYSFLLDNMETGYAFHKAVVRSYLKGDDTPMLYVFLGESRIIYER
jgi:hypothetical protein